MKILLLLMTIQLQLQLQPGDPMLKVHGEITESMMLDSSKIMLADLYHDFLVDRRKTNTFVSRKRVTVSYNNFVVGRFSAPVEVKSDEANIKYMDRISPGTLIHRRKLDLKGADPDKEFGRELKKRIKELFSRFDIDGKGITLKNEVTGVAIKYNGAKLGYIVFPHKLYKYEIETETKEKK